jgi:hypothetical protein
MLSSRPSKRARTIAPPRSPDNVLEIESKGDLFIKLGTNLGDLMRVSSKHLASASNVFDNLLSSNFAEGRRIHNVSNPLLLPDDNPTRLDILFKIVSLEDCGRREVTSVRQRMRA